MAYLGREAAKAPLVTADIPDDSITSAKIVDATIAAGDLAANSVDSSELVDGSVDLSHMSSESVDEDNLHISNSPTDGHVLTARSSAAGDMTWEAASSFDPDAAVVFNDTGNDVDFRVESTNSENALFVQGSDGTVCIGTTTPGFQYGGTPRGLHIDAQSLGGSNCILRMTDSENSWEIVEDGDFFIKVGTTDRLHISGSSGNVTVYGTFTSSDERLKENITDLTNSLDKVIQLQGFSFTWKEKDEEGCSLGIDDSTHYGLSAQKVESVFPEIVLNSSINDHVQPKYINEDGEIVPAVVEKRYKSLNYSGLIPVLIESIKELSAKNDALEAENTALKTRMDALEARVLALEE